MVATPATFPVHNRANTLATTRETLQALFAQVEAELLRSPVYQQALAHLGQEPKATAAHLPQAVLRAVGREAIRLAMRRVIRQYRGDRPTHAEAIQTPSPLAAPPARHPSSHPTPISRTSTPTPWVTPPAETLNTEVIKDLERLDSLQKQQLPGATTLHPVSSRASSEASEEAQNSPSVPTTVKVTPLAAAATARASASPARVLSASPRRAVVTPPKSPEAQKRDAILAHIGETLQQARQASGLSIDHLHLKTWVPVHQLKALELGQVDQLPEDIYIQGFIRRLAPILNLDSQELLAPLKALAPKLVSPSWQPASSRSIKATNAELQPLHLYMGYAALMASAAGGLVWMSQQPQAEAWLQRPLSPEPAPAAQPTTDLLPNAFTAPVTGDGGAIASPEMAPPETANPM